MRLSGFQQFCLVTLRTAIGWHFAYEGFYKLMLPGWTRSGERVGAWSAAGYLKGATGPFAAMFHDMAGHASAMHAVDLLVPIGLLLVGLSLMLGLLTQLGCLGAIGFLAMFYLSQPPLSGMPQAGAEGTYLFVNKNLIELIAVATLMAFRTGTIAGLDQLWMRNRSRPAFSTTSVSGS
jgi:thiosulfate dehydrogenase (quinone) large subunit